MELTLDVKGMTCGHCKQSVEGALTSLEGVEKVDVQLDAGKVNVTFEDGKVTKEKMAEAVEEQGFDVV
ncbi:copper chaperone CopZ [Salirhabdus salicampi]|uniref:copper chaperone CopZ n=1 Tax=Salirhabdus salicampi TaxID=476102 RepID=UPI0020C38109|nr:copper chaperone CopZ [Salirhabdus salicampi]MCP8617719.1 copper chaperone CopZ [Salirhabdus salicampi]